jgi:hypothetical protein
MLQTGAAGAGEPARTDVGREIRRPRDTAASAARFARLALRGRTEDATPKLAHLSKAS